MAYRNLTLTNIAGEITTTYNDNNMRRQASSLNSTGPGLMMTATAKSGLDMQRFRADASNLTTALAEFSPESDIAKMIAAANQANSQNQPMSVIRIGAKPFHVKIKKSTTGMYEKETWLNITPYATRETDTGAGLLSTVEQMGVILMPFREGNLIRQRVVIYNVDTAAVLFDSEGLAANPDAEAIFDVNLDVPAGMFLWTPSAFDTNILTPTTSDAINQLADIRAAIQTRGGVRLNGTTVTDSSAWETKVNIVDQFALSNQTLADYNLANSGGEFSVENTKGTAGSDINHCERYAGNELAYEELEFESISFLHCDKCEADIQGVNLTSSMKLNEQLSWQQRNLGYLWKYSFNGQPNMFMARSLTPFATSNVGTYSYDGITYTLSDDQKALGDLGNIVEFHFHPKASGTDTEVESYFSDVGHVECHVSFDCDRVSLDDALGRNEAEFEAYALAGWVNTDVDKYGRDGNAFTALVAYTDDGSGVDAVTGLIEAVHAAYLAGGYIEVNAEDLSSAEYTAYIDAGHVATIDIETSFCTLSISTQRFDSGDDDHIVRFRPSLVDGSHALSTYCLSNPTLLNADPFFMTHYDLTGINPPEAVMSRLFTFTDPIYAGQALTDAATLTVVAKNQEVREISFLHQAATAAYVASTNYSQTVALVPTSAPGPGRNAVSEWAGNPAEYTVQTNGDVLVTKNGTGVLGTKLLAGATDYRGGAAFGGIILTNGNLLPNQIPYGIDDSDEALDEMGNPIDLGKHVLVIGAYGLLNDPKSAYKTNSGKRINIRQSSSYNGSAAPIIAMMLASQAPGTEPIGIVRGKIAGFDPRSRTPRSVLDNLAALRICMVDQTGVISSIYTAALRTSDYSKVSSILAANAILRALRGASMSVIGSAYTDVQIASLASRLDGISKGLIKEGHAQQLNVQLRGSQLDRINGVIRMSVRFVPPLSIEAITIDLTLEPPASGI